MGQPGETPRTERIKVKQEVSRSPILLEHVSKVLFSMTIYSVGHADFIHEASAVK